VCAEQEQSFKEFAQRPENKALLEHHQQEEISAALKLQEQLQELQLQQQVRMHPISCECYCIAGWPVSCLSALRLAPLVQSSAQSY
jgi:hypothetical protein